MEWRLDFGHLLTLAAVLASISIGYGRIDNRLNALETQQTREMVRHEQLLDELHSLQREVIKLQTQFEERQIRQGKY